MAFSGWLAKFGDYQVPNKFLTKYKDTSNQRIEIDAYRDTAQLLHRETSPNFKTSVVLSFRKLTIAEMTLLKKTIIKSGMINETERKVSLTYWNSEEMDYKSGEFYITDLPNEIVMVYEDVPEAWYDEFDLEAIEY